MEVRIQALFDDLNRDALRYQELYYMSGTSAIWFNNVAPVTPFPPRLGHGLVVGRLHPDLFLELKMSEFFEAIWHGEGVGDGSDLEEALPATSR